ncbi:ATPase, histidine kinase-, DNA gyrase B (macronuclear) [Tetrahymena thermophila SB210]|uniref:histidine kinase n=1 Tax=Tetrahymena thermophila (strain SB210) TaxID=312017 RepID=Q23Q42_TETTS|nr:ATPase, histidine kinase-, DNA gyrase B [Tetrahymena thermophila SB210]EAR98742.2 ATPase, histidine kinase-, DNA gyrase B [Tetrahymena thermophila SB210]|eukprot:XP_001018987.2 ATPase, histidine kinase-, DNA gyrase B [Tetrahymena thermophila SB210]
MLTKSEILDNQFQNKNIQQNLKQQKCAEYLKKINSFLMVCIVFFVGLLSLNQQEYVLGSIIMLSNIFSLIFHQLLQKYGKNDQNREFNLSKLKINGRLKLQLILIISAGNFATICVSIFEFLIKIQDNYYQAINATLFLQVYLIAVLQKIQQLKIAFSWIVLIILGIIPEGLAVINKEQKLLYANPTLKKILKSNKKTEVLQILLNLGNQKVKYEQAITNKPSSKNIKTQDQQNNSQAKDKDNNKQSQQSIKQDQIQQTQKGIEQKDLQIQINSQNKSEILSQKIHLVNDKLQRDENNALIAQNYDQQEGLESYKSKQNDFSIINQNIEVKMSDSSRLNRESQRLLKEPSQQINITNLASFNSQNKNLLNISQFGNQDEDSHHGRLRSLSQNRKREYSLYSFHSLKVSNKVKKSIRRESSIYQGKGKSQMNKQNTLQSANFGQSEQSDIISYKGFGIQPEKFNQQTDYFEGTIDESTKNMNFEMKESKFQKVQNMPEIMQNSINSYKKQNSYGLSMNYSSYQRNNSFQRKKYNLQGSLKSNKILQKQQQALNPTNNINLNMNESQKVNKLEKLISQQLQRNSKFMQQSTKSINLLNKTLLDSKIQTDRNQIKQQNFKLKVKFKKSQTANNEQQGQITYKKTDVKRIIENMLEQDSQVKKDQSSQKFTDQEKCSKNNSKLNINDNQKVDQNYQKQTSFSKCVKNQNENDLNYFQQTDTKAKMQVQFQDQDLILEFLQVDALVSNEKKDPLVLIIVQDLWKDLYQKKVQDTQKDKMRIFASLSHELRTPLNCSISMLEVIRENVEQINPELIEEYLNPALFSNKLLLNQINDLLDYVQMDSGKFKYSFYDFNVTNLFNDCKKLISMQAKLKNIEIIISIGKQVPEMISSDPNRIRQILLNFLSNSLKFTKKGYIEIGITLFDNKKGLLKVYVKDTGIGITKENLDTIFDFCGKVNYNQKDQHLNRQGCGLGLTISNSIAKGLVKNGEDDGGIKVESDYGHGSTFSILIQDMSINQQNQKEDNTQNTLNNNTILEKFSEKQFQNEDNQIYSQKQYSYSVKSNFNQQAQIEDLAINRQSKQRITPQIDFVYTLNENSNSFLSDNSKQYMRNDINKNSSFTNNISKIEEIQEEQIIQIQNNKKNQNIIDSSVIIEYEDDNKKEIKINSNLKIRNYYQRFEEMEEKNKQIEINKPQSLEFDFKNIGQSHLENQEHFFNQNNYSKQKLQKSNQNLKNQKNKQSPIKIQNFDNRAFNFRSSSDIFEKTDRIHSFQNEEEEGLPHQYSELNSLERNSRNYFSNLYTKVKTANTGTMDKLDRSAKEQEGFTSYVGLSRFLDAQLSQQKISSQVFDNYEEQINTNKELQYIQEASQNFNNIESNLDPQQTINLIKELNQIQRKCGCPQFMIVDDNQFNTYALSKILGQYFFTFQCLSDGFSAIEEVQSLYQKSCCKAPKIIFMDIEMPMKNGYETAVEINQFYEQVALPVQYQPIIIACTAYVGQEDVDAAMQSGMKDFINKPILKNGLESLILNWKNKFL